MRRFSLPFLAVALLAGATALGYTLIERSAGVPTRWADPQDLRFAIHNETSAGMRNRDGGLVISTDSTPLESIRAAMRSWEQIPGSALRFRGLSLTGQSEQRDDGVNLISFADTGRNRAMLNGAIAITFFSSTPGGTFTNADILVNPEFFFSTTLQPRSFDIEGTIAHELGHALGLDHSGVVTATMFAFAAFGTNRLAELTTDERAFAREIYPDGSAGGHGEVFGQVRGAQGAPIRGALVTLIEPGQNIAIGTMTGASGDYRLPSVPPGSYFVSAEPADGPTEVSDLLSGRAGTNTRFRTTFLGGGNPVRISVEVSRAVAADLVVVEEAPTLNIEGGGAAPLGGRDRVRVGADLRRGASYSIEIHGDGLQSPEISETSLQVLGAGIAIRPGTFRTDMVELPGGEIAPSVRFDVDVAASAPLGLATIRLDTANETALFTGGIRIRESLQRPEFPALGVTNGASFQPGPLVPGAIFSLFGTSLGPAAGVSAGFAPLTGKLERLLDGVSVLIHGAPAPLYFVSEGQINFQVPVEVAGESQVFASVVRRGEWSPPVRLRVAAAGPGIFLQFPRSSQAVVLNQDGTVNGPDNPAARGAAVVIFATGQGEVRNEPGTGKAAPSDPLATTMADTQVRIGGAEAQMLFSGLAPGFVGLLQVNAVIPPEAPSGDAVPIELQIGAASSPAGVTIAID